MPRTIQTHLFIVTDCACTDEPIGYTVTQVNAYDSDATSSLHIQFKDPIRAFNPSGAEVDVNKYNFTVSVHMFIDFCRQKWKEDVNILTNLIQCINAIEL